MRRTFAAKFLFTKVHQAIVFLLGLTNDPVTTARIQQEAIMYGDIVQGDFVDSYHNLTHKGVMGYRWITENCPQAKFIVKIDDDVFLNPFKLVNDFFPKLDYKNGRQLACQVRPKNTSPIVRGKSKWKVAEEEFKGLKYYPIPYCNGYFVIITSDLIEPMLRAVRKNPFFWVDDVYLFGLLPATVGNVTFINISKNLTLKFDLGNDCYAKNGLNCTLLGVAQWKNGRETTLWNMVMKLLPESVINSFGMNHHTVL